MRKQKRKIRQQKVNAEMERLANIRENQLEKARSKSRVGVTDEMKVIRLPSERESLESLITRPVQAKIGPPPRMRIIIAPLTGETRPENRYGEVRAEPKEHEERRPITPPLPLLLVLSRAPAAPSSVHPAYRGKPGQNRRVNEKVRLAKPSRQRITSIPKPTALHPALLTSSSTFTSPTIPAIKPGEPIPRQKRVKLLPTREVQLPFAPPPTPYSTPPPSPPTRTESPVKRRKTYEKWEEGWRNSQKDTPITLPLRLKNPPSKTETQDEKAKQLSFPENPLAKAAITPLPTTPTSEIKNPEPKVKQTPSAEEILEEAIRTPLPTIPAHEKEELNQLFFARELLKEVVTPQQQEILCSNLQEWHRLQVTTLGSRTRELDRYANWVLRRGTR